ncbi:MAG: transcription-repair coupling factor, partial [Acetobacteraceae bacterium]|nr:transcription-repair coupling factor [Acetobacteraceae bacterium]
MTATLYGAPEGYDALLLAQRRREHRGSVLHVCRDDSRMARLAEALAFFAPEVEVVRFPAWDCLPYDRVSPNPEIVSERVATLARLVEPSGKKPRIVLTTVNALVQRVPPREAFEGATLSLRAGGTADPEAVIRFLEANGYNRTGTVMEPGEYASRGGILDLFPAGEPAPVRLDLFGDQIESIRRFDPASQRSTDRLQALTLRPVSEVPLDPASISRFREGYRELFGPGAAEDPLYVSVSEGHRHPGLEHWVPLFHERMETLLDYLPDPAASLDHQAEEALAARLEMIADHYDARRAPAREGETPYRPLPPGRLYLDQAQWDAMLAPAQPVQFSPYSKPAGAAGADAGGRPGTVFTKAGGQIGSGVFDQLREQATAWAGQKDTNPKDTKPKDGGKRLVVAAWTRGSRERLQHMLHENGFRAEAAESWAACLALPAPVVPVVVLGLERGFVGGPSEDGAAIVGEQDLLGERISRPPRRRKRADEFIAEATELAEGDL